MGDSGKTTISIFRQYSKTGITYIRNVGAVMRDLWREMQEDGYLHIDPVGTPLITLKSSYLHGNIRPSICVFTHKERASLIRYFNHCTVHLFTVCITYKQIQTWLRVLLYSSLFIARTGFNAKAPSLGSSHSVPVKLHKPVHALLLLFL
jgi:hypothetical protein